MVCHADPESGDGKKAGRTGCVALQSRRQGSGRTAGPAVHLCRFGRGRLPASPSRVSGSGPPLGLLHPPPGSQQDATSCKRYPPRCRIFSVRVLEPLPPDGGALLPLREGDRLVLRSRPNLEPTSTRESGTTGLPEGWSGSCAARGLPAGWGIRASVARRLQILVSASRGTAQPLTLPNSKTVALKPAVGRTRMGGAEAVGDRPALRCASMAPLRSPAMARQ